MNKRKNWELLQLIELPSKIHFLILAWYYKVLTTIVTILLMYETVAIYHFVNHLSLSRRRKKFHEILVRQKVKMLLWLRAQG